MKKVMVAAAVVVGVLWSGFSLAETVDYVGPGNGLTGRRTHGPNVRLDVGAGPGISVGRNAVGISFAGTSCAPGSYLSGFDAAGAPVCTGLPSVPPSLAGQSCPAGTYVTGFDAAGGIVCSAAPTPVTRRWSASGNSFIPTFYSAVWDITDGGHCVYAPPSGGSLWMERALELPDGAHISWITLAAIDFDPVFGSALWLEERNLSGNVVSSSNVGSLGSTGMGLWGFNPDIIVNNANHMYTLAWFNNGVTGAGIALCGVVVTYQTTP